VTVLKYLHLVNLFLQTDCGTVAVQLQYGWWVDILLNGWA